MYVYLAAHFPYKVVIDITLFNKQNRKFDVTYLLRHQFFHTVKENFIFRGTSNSQTQNFVSKWPVGQDFKTKINI